MSYYNSEEEFLLVYMSTKLIKGGKPEVSKEELKEAAGAKLNVFQRVLKSLADVFVPILPALVAAGLLMGLNNVLTAEGLFIEGKSLIQAYPHPFIGVRSAIKN